jgi:FlaG/FlaF family flagellin (archaellin)
MKGISEILAMILIVIIVVALIGMTYTFATGLFSTTTNATQQQTNQVTGNMGKTVSIVAAKCNAGTNYVFSIRNTGPNAIQATELAAFVDGSLLSMAGSGFATQASGNITQYTSSTAGGAAGTTHTLKVSAPAGEVQTQVTC